jgi:hypothetical protein
MGTNSGDDIGTENRMTREFGVRLVEDDELPDRDWMVAATPTQVVAIVRRSRADERTLAEVWVAFRQQQGERGARVLAWLA